MKPDFTRAAACNFFQLDCLDSTHTCTALKMSETEAANLYLPPKFFFKSAVWEYFGYPKNDRGVVLEDGYPVCKICGRRVAANGGNTSNMFSHIREHHPSVKIKVIHNFYNLRPYYFCHAEGIPVCQKDAHQSFCVTIQMPRKMCDLIDG